MNGDGSHIEVGGGAPSDEETAAAIAALESLLRETAGAPTRAFRQPDRWLQTALLDGVERDASGESWEPWIKT
ncbi:MAG: hypothetical protein ACYCU0_06410 [Solirubrobacteraceae bacterium]